MRSRLRPFGSARHVVRAALVAALVIALGPTLGAQAVSLPAPTHISAAVVSDVAPPCVPSPTCSAPGPLIVQNTPFTLRVSLTDDTGSAAAFNKDTPLTLTLTLTGDTTSLDTTTVTMPGNAPTADFRLQFATFANGVTVTVSAGRKAKNSSITPGTTQSFDVLKTLQTFDRPSGPFQNGSGPGGCADVSSANPVCGILVLPNGANSPVVLATGSCTGLGCDTKGSVTDIVADIGGLYGPSDPATLIIRCYRTVCGRGGVSQLLGLAAGSQETGALSTAPPCPAKNYLGDLPYCTDQVQNVRLNADDSLIYILFANDFRGSI